MAAKPEIKEFYYYSDTNEVSDVTDEKKGQKVEKQSCKNKSLKNIQTLPAKIAIEVLDCKITFLSILSKNI